MNKPPRLQLKGAQEFTHYAFLGLFFLPVVFNAVSIVQILTDTYDGMRSLTEHAVVSVPFIVAGLIFWFRQYKRLRFRVFEVSHSPEQIQRAVEMTALQLEWVIQTNKKGYLRANRDGSWFGSSWGEMITIVYDNQFVCINSISDPNASPTVSSFGWDRRNVKTFMRNLATVLKADKLVKS